VRHLEGITAAHRAARLNGECKVNRCEIPDCGNPADGQLDGKMYCREHASADAIRNAELQAVLLPKLLRVLTERPDGEKQDWWFGPSGKFTRSSELWHVLKPVRDAWPSSREEFELLWQSGQREAALRPLITRATEDPIRALIASPPICPMTKIDDD